MADYSDDFNTDPFVGRFTKTWDAGVSWLSGSMVGGSGYCIWNGGQTDNIVQYAKISSAGFNTVALILRGSSTGGSEGFYVIITYNDHLYISRGNNAGWIADEINASFPFASGETLAITIQGTGTSTTVKAWKNPSNNTPHDKDNWDSASDPADLTLDLSGGAGAYYDTGKYVGFGSDTGPRMDNWYAGDSPSGVDNTPKPATLGEFDTDLRADAWF